ncbi:Alpha-1,3-mannosyltransferase-like protein [Microbotryomycetes sp. JL221]|nr:Alpha-1,3-mannosyltransferase-like protein [Microbotryomycetes sp. JL221]
MNLDAGRSNVATVYEPLELDEHLRIGFIHPDLGIGGAERFVVDAAISLQRLGHHVELFTSYHDHQEKGRSFVETRDGTLSVHVLGGWLFPRSILGRFTIVCAILRQLHLTWSFLLASFMYHVGFKPFVLSTSTRFKNSNDWSCRRQLEPFDVIVVDQLSACIPLLRWLGQNRIVFYCHFPDQLLSRHKSVTHSSNDPRRSTSHHQSLSLGQMLRSLYRTPIDSFEQSTTGEADKILVNSEFTSQVFQTVFKPLNRIPRTIYPAVDVEQFQRNQKEKEDFTKDSEVEWLVRIDENNKDVQTLLSINRFEKKKNLSLAVDSFNLVLKKQSNLRLILAGGYDDRLKDNVDTLLSLVQQSNKLGLTHMIYSTNPSHLNPKSLTIESTEPQSLPQILFLLNMTDKQKKYLLSCRQEQTVCLLYTPSFEHFGIVPLEAMSCGLIVLTTNTGGPTETVLDFGLKDSKTTGLLRQPNQQDWSEAIFDLSQLSLNERLSIGQAGQQRVLKEFSIERLGLNLEKACQDAASIGQPIYTEIGFKKFLVFIFSFLACFGAGLIAFIASLMGGRVDEFGKPIVGIHQMMSYDRRMKEQIKLKNQVLKEVMKEKMLRGQEL